MSIIDKINYLYGTKLDIKEAIINKGVQVSDDDTLTYTNNTSEDIIVNECGIVQNYAPSNSTREPVLLSRTKFDEPQIIHVGETKTFTHKIKI